MTSCIYLLSLLLHAEPGEQPLSLLGRYAVTCPVCKQDFTSIACAESNRRAGVDRDLFARALGPQPEFYRIATCPKCGYSGYQADFDAHADLPPGLSDQVLKSPKLSLPADFGPQSDPRQLDAADRYALAVTCYRWRGKSDEAIAWLYLRASWIAREEGAVLPPDDRLVRMLKYLQRWRPDLAGGGNQADAELQTASHLSEAITSGEFNRYQRPYAELALTLLLRRHGENRPAAEMLKRLEGYDRFEEPLRAGITRMGASIDREREQQTHAAEYFERALLADQITPANRGPACYLLAELYRRLGRDREAIRWYDRALADPTLPPDLQTWAREQRATTKE
jgi:tetratricopeptide (TPR) repeat protein